MHFMLGEIPKYDPHLTVEYYTVHRRVDHTLPE